MKRIITYGTFDLLHYGHINLLRRAKALGDYLIVALSTDEFNWNMKQKKCYFAYEERKALLEAIRYVDLVIPEENWEQKRTDVHEFHVDTFVIGDDWQGKFDFLGKEGCEVVYLPRTPEISTSQMKQDLGAAGAVGANGAAAAATDDTGGHASAAAATDDTGGHAASSAVANAGGHAAAAVDHAADAAAAAVNAATDAASGVSAGQQATGGGRNGKRLVGTDPNERCNAEDFELLIFSVIAEQAVAA